MSTSTPPAAQRAAASTSSSGSGWILFAGLVTIVAGAYNALTGLSTITSDYGAIERAHDVLFSINVDTWAWFWLIVGVTQLVTGGLVLARNLWGLFFAVCGAVLSATVAVFAIFAWPVWAFSVLTLDLLIMYGLLTHRDSFD
jgi:hypothetical protein